MKTAVRGAASALLALLAGLAIWHSAAEPEEGVLEIAATLRCPDCQAASAAESRSEMAGAMRTEIARRFAQGQDAEEIREYFRGRYGDWILLTPRASGIALLVWLAPVLALLVAGLIVVRVYRPRAVASAPARGAGLTVLVVLAVAGGGFTVMLTRTPAPPMPASAGAVDPLTRGRALQERGDLHGAIEVFRQAVQDRPGHRTARCLLAFALLKAGLPAEAVAALRPLIRRSPDDPDVLLVLGSARYALDPEHGRRTLRRFLAAAPPGHPARAQVGQLLEQGHNPKGRSR
ncbi:cytochrome c-type biogenesis protein [Sinosporangium siamense]|uniref:Cytochrome c-type biogenesis protein n=1 Tax=Sinosporangium siamense TaxID=1367973 RepID=A0A919RIP1_9ACTN|nr:cytochrome c-type biogenesis protein [Sinosporangium siamense]GII94528.1 hypothetical protein Ssi02_47590 [Sinosporangium siamense]